jgi:hypothetical protein
VQQKQALRRKAKHVIMKKVPIHLTEFVPVSLVSMTLGVLIKRESRRNAAYVGWCSKSKALRLKAEHVIMKKLLIHLTEFVPVSLVSRTLDVLTKRESRRDAVSNKIVRGSQIVVQTRSILGASRRWYQYFQRRTVNLQCTCPQSSITVSSRMLCISMGGIHLISRENI